MGLVPHNNNYIYTVSHRTSTRAWHVSLQGQFVCTCMQYSWDTQHCKWHRIHQFLTNTPRHTLHRDTLSWLVFITGNVSTVILLSNGLRIQKQPGCARSFPFQKGRTCRNDSGKKCTRNERTPFSRCGYTDIVMTCSSTALHVHAGCRKHWLLSACAYRSKR